MRCLLPLLGLCLGSLATIAQPAMGQPMLSSTATAMSTVLDLDGEGSAATHIVKVADITVSTDHSGGLTLMLTASRLTKPQGSDIAIQITTVGEGAIAPSPTDFTVPADGTYTYVTSWAGAEQRDVYILYTPNALQDPGDYSATLNIAVVDN